MSRRRYQESRARWSDFLEHIWVRCPSCAEAAHLRRVEDVGYRLTCLGCSHTKEWRRVRGRPFYNPGIGPYLAYFELDLWLQTPCRGHVLWAYNRDHLYELERLVEAGLRGRSRDPDHGWSNSSLLSRLPRWMKASANRDDVLRSIQILQQRAAQET